MLGYRVYKLRPDGRIQGRVAEAVHADDDAAIEWAKQLVNDQHDIELWQGAHIIQRFSSKSK